MKPRLEITNSITDRAFSSERSKLGGYYEGPRRFAARSSVRGVVPGLTSRIIQQAATPDAKLAPLPPELAASIIATSKSMGVPKEAVLAVLVKAKAGDPVALGEMQKAGAVWEAARKGDKKAKRAIQIASQGYDHADAEAATSAAALAAVVTSEKMFVRHGSRE